MSCFLVAGFNRTRQVAVPLVSAEYPGAYILAGKVPCHASAARRLVLHNNYTFLIFVKLRGMLESGDISPSYEIVAESKGNKQTVTLVSEEVSTSQMVKPSGQLSVCIDNATLSPDSYLRIPFKLEDESDTIQAAAPQHFAVFYADPTGERRSRNKPASH